MSIEMIKQHNSPGDNSVNQLIEHLFRRQSGQMVSTLTRFFGPENLDLVEDVVQETLLKALQQWRFRGVPENPAAWILQSARNQAIDVLRRQSVFRGKQKEIVARIEDEWKPELPDSRVRLNSELKDDQLRMMFTCCHPALSREARVALTLKSLCGFSVAEIARAFLSEEATVAQRLVRAKRKMREEKLPFEVPKGGELRERLDSVLDVLYLFFNEGYSAHHGENLVRAELCAEAIRLAGLLAEHPAGDTPKVHALLALALFQGSHLPARVDSNGELLLLNEQNRKLWDQNLIHLGLRHLEKSASGDELSEYHLQAGIAAAHAIAPDYASTDWRQILSYYDLLVDIDHSPVVALNRAVALAMVDGPAAGIAALDRIRSLPPMKSYYLLPSTYGEFYLQMGERETAASHYNQALQLVGTEPERRFLLRRINECSE
jgi:RNA polymerase sigma-70 factor (ECF subfamily)